MAIFLKVKDQIYKAPDRIIVGRGAPFNVFLDDRTICRAHILIINKNNKIYVKDLASKNGTMVKGKKIKPNKFFQLNLNDPIELGKYSIEILASVPEENFVEITSSAVSVSRSYLQKYYFHFFYILGSAPFFYTTFMESINVKKIIFNLVAIVLVWFIIQGFIKLSKKIFPPLAIKEIFISDEGFTIHYSDGQNMTFKQEDIQSWYMTTRKILYLRAYNQDYRVHTQGQFQSLIEFLESKLSLKKIEKISTEPVVAIMVFGAATIAFLCREIFRDAISIAAGAFISFSCLAMLLSERFRRMWPFPATKIYSRRKQTFSIIGAGLFSAFYVSEFVDKNKNMALFEVCLAQSSEACSMVDFHQVDKKRISAKVLLDACNSSNSSACYYMKKRDIANQAD